MLRHIGLVHVRQFRAGEPGARQEALRHLSLANHLADLLAERVPTGRTGRLLAGFFNRRVYINEQLIELLIEEGRPAEALHQSERAKARALQTLLRTQGKHAVLSGTPVRSTARSCDPGPERSLPSSIIWARSDAGCLPSMRPGKSRPTCSGMWPDGRSLPQS